MNAPTRPGAANASAANPQLLLLSALLDLERRARSGRKAELVYLIVNDTALVVPCQRAALWRHGRVAAVSGVAMLETSGPYGRFLTALMPAAERLAAADVEAPLLLDAAMLGMTPADWAEWLGPAVVYVPLPDPRGGQAGGLLLARPEPFHPGELQLLAALGGTYGLALAAGELPRRRVRTLRRRRLLQAAAVLALLAASFLPVRSSVLAPAEIVAAAPVPIRAPFDGVVDQVLVSPNAPVRQGDRLLSFETTERRARAEVADKALEIARAEYAESSQLAFADPQAKGRLPLLRAKVEQAQLEADYNRTMLARAEVTAPRDGVAVFDEAQQWIGRPVALGERIMVLAPPQSRALDIAIPVAELVSFEPAAETLFFPNVAPDEPTAGRLASVGYAATLNAEGVLAYTARAQLAADAPALRLGLKGTAKIYGPRRPFLLWVLRRPLAVLSEWLSL